MLGGGADRPADNTQTDSMYCLGYMHTCRHRRRRRRRRLRSLWQAVQQVHSTMSLLSNPSSPLHIYCVALSLVSAIMSLEHHVSSPPASSQPSAPAPDAAACASSEPFAAICQRIHADAVSAAQAAIAAAADDASARQVHVEQNQYRIHVFNAGYRNAKPLKKLSTLQLGRRETADQIKPQTLESMPRQQTAAPPSDSAATGHRHGPRPGQAAGMPRRRGFAGANCYSFKRMQAIQRMGAVCA